MGPSSAASVWKLVAEQHGVVAHHQLRALGYGSEAIKHRVRAGRLHPRTRGVYAVGRPDVTWYGHLMATVLACGAGAMISHESAAALWQVRSRAPGTITLTLPAERSRRRSGVRVHCRRSLAPGDVDCHKNIPVTSPARTLVDIALSLSPAQLERAVNVADSLDLIDPEALRLDCERFAGQPGVTKLRTLLDRRTFRATDSVLEQRFLAIVRRASLPLPLTQRHQSSFRTDFLWPELGLVVETDSLRYHRTPSQQYRDRLRDQAHFAAGRTPLRFTHAQVFFEEPHVRRLLSQAERRLRP